MGMRQTGQHVRRYVWNAVVNGLLTSVLVPRPLRWRGLVAMGLSVHGARIGSRGFFGSRLVSIGSGSVVNQEVFFDGSDVVSIGRDCHVAMRVSFITSSHRLGPHERRGGPADNAPVTVADGCWIGAGAMLLPGVTLGAGCVVASGAVVVGDCEPDTLYAGVPATAVRSLVS